MEGHCPEQLPELLCKAAQAKHPGFLITLHAPQLLAQQSLCLCRVIEIFGTERASEDFIFNNQSLPFLEQVTKSGATYKFIQGVIYTPQEPTPIPFVSPTGFLNADLSPFVAHIQTQVHPTPRLTPLLLPLSVCVQLWEKSVHRAPMWHKTGVAPVLGALHTGRAAKRALSLFLHMLGL